MNINDVNYVFNDHNKKTTLVFLHGWGQNIEMMRPISNYYEEFFNILIIDFPGFGKSKEPSEEINFIDYVELVHDIILFHRLDDIIIIGHSFGGRIGLLYSSKYSVDKLICLASPYCKEEVKPSLKVRFFKFVSKFESLNWLKEKMKKHVGSADYRNASPIMRKIMVQSINIDMVDDIKKIECPTLLVWGNKDSAVPINRCYELNKLIKNSGVVVLKNGTHYAYLEQLNYLITILDSFFEVRR